jgi:superoxide dismutase, Cu-Zn family
VRHRLLRPDARHAAFAAVVVGLSVFAASPSLAGSDRVRAAGEPIRYGGGRLVPAGAVAEVEAVYDSAGDTTVTLRVRGMLPRHEYGAHVHAGRCHPTSARAAGGTFQNVPNPDPEWPADPAFVNPQNEIWLDFATDAAGAAVATTTVAWQFSPARRPGSVMIHAQRTRAGGPDGPAGTAGARLACLSVGF